MGWLKIQKIKYLENRTKLFLCFRRHILRSHHFIAEVTFNLQIASHIQIQKKQLSCCPVCRNRQVQHSKFLGTINHKQLKLIKC